MKETRKYIREMLSGLYDLPEIDSFFFMIMNYLTGLSKSQLIVNPNKVLTISDFEKVKEITTRLSHFEPLQYILGKTEFYGLPFLVEPGVLIPRFETEELVDLIIKENLHRKGLKILDIGCGSGCIAITLKKNLSSAEVWANDISDEAIKVAIGNARLNKVNITIEKYDILGKYPFSEKGFNIIVSNPPYVTNKEKRMMSKNVLDFEPELALFVSDENPLVFYEAILTKSHELLQAPDLIYFEINETFGEEMRVLMVREGFEVEIIKDINGKDRIAKGIKKGKKFHDETFSPFISQNISLTD